MVRFTGSSQLQEILKRQIDNGRWEPGDLLPSESQMTAMFEASRTVIRKALDILEGDGRVYRVNGKGTVVAQPKFGYEAIGAAATWSKQGEAPPWQCSVLAEQRIPVGGDVGRLLDLPAREDIYELTFVQGVKDTPASLTQMFLRRDSTSALKRRGPHLLEEGGPDALAQLRERCGLCITESQVSIEAIRTNRFEAECLSIPQNAPVFLLGSLAIGPDGKPVAFSRTVVRSDQFRFDVVIRYPREGGRPPVGTASGRTSAVVGNRACVPVNR